MARAAASRMRRAARADRGTALVEFALVAPVFMLLLLAMLDMGKAFNYWIDQTHLANMGVRWAVVTQNPGNSASPSPLTLQQYIASLTDTQELRSGGTTSLPSGLSVCVTYPGKSFATATVGDPVQVVVASAYHWLPLIGDAVGHPTVTLRTRATMRLEQTPSLASPSNLAANPLNDVNPSGC